MTSIADEIDRLAAQRAAGHLSDAEFEAAKARLFADPGPPRLSDTTGTFDHFHATRTTTESCPNPPLQSAGAGIVQLGHTR